MTIPVDVFEEVSPELSVVIESVLEAPDEGDASSLGAVRTAMQGGILQELSISHRIPADQDDILSAEIDGLIEQYGTDALAVRFARPRASADLTTVIEATIDREGEPQALTLGRLRETMRTGLLAELIGTGDILADDEQTLWDEVDRLIDLHGAHTIAEKLMLFL